MPDGEEEAKQGELGLDVKKVTSEKLNKSSTRKTGKSRALPPQGTLGFGPKYREGTILTELDVIANKEKIISALQGLMRSGNGEATEEVTARAYEELVLPFMGEKKTTRKGEQFTRRVYDGTGDLNDIGIEGPNFACNTDEFKLTNAYVFGSSAFIASHDARIQGSILIGDNDFAGSRIETGQRYRSLDCINPQVSNSIVFGRYVFGNARNGYIRDSIIAGRDALFLPWDGLRLVNVDVITQDGITHYDNHVFDRKVRVEAQGPLRQVKK